MINKKIIGKNKKKIIISIVLCISSLCLYCGSNNNGNNQTMKSVVLNVYTTPKLVTTPTTTPQAHIGLEISRGNISRKTENTSNIAPVVGRNNNPTVVKNTKLKYVDSFIGSITMYTLNPLECSKKPWEKGYGVTASGKKVKPHHTVAMGKKFPFGTRLKIEGFDNEFVNEDTGNGVVGNVIDVYVENRKTAFKFGRQDRKVYIIEYGKKNKK